MSNHATLLKALNKACPLHFAPPTVPNKSMACAQNAGWPTSKFVIYLLSYALIMSLTFWDSLTPLPLIEIRWLIVTSIWEPPFQLIVGVIYGCPITLSLLIARSLHNS